MQQQSPRVINQRLKATPQLAQNWYQSASYSPPQNDHFPSHIYNPLGLHNQQLQLQQQTNNNNNNYPSIFTPGYLPPNSFPHPPSIPPPLPQFFDPATGAPAYFDYLQPQYQQQQQVYNGEYMPQEYVPSFPILDTIVEVDQNPQSLKKPPATASKNTGIKVSQDKMRRMVGTVGGGSGQNKRKIITSLNNFSRRMDAINHDSLNNQQQQQQQQQEEQQQQFGPYSKKAVLSQMFKKNLQKKDKYFKEEQLMEKLKTSLKIKIPKKTNVWKQYIGDIQQEQKINNTISEPALFSRTQGKGYFSLQERDKMKTLKDQLASQKQERNKLNDQVKFLKVQISKLRQLERKSEKLNYKPGVKQVNKFQPGNQVGLVRTKQNLLSLSGNRFQSDSQVVNSNTGSKRKIIKNPSGSQKVLQSLLSTGSAQTIGNEIKKLKCHLEIKKSNEERSIQRRKPSQTSSELRVINQRLKLSNQELRSKLQEKQQELSKAISSTKDGQKEILIKKIRNANDLVFKLHEKQMNDGVFSPLFDDPIIREQQNLIKQEDDAQQQDNLASLISKGEEGLKELDAFLDIEDSRFQDIEQKSMEHAVKKMKREFDMSLKKQFSQQIKLRQDQIQEELAQLQRENHQLLTESSRLKYHMRIKQIS